MFYDGIENWDVSNVTDMSFMFCYARNFNEDISSWNVSNVTNMRGMFQFASSFNQDISMWNVSKVENMASMFYDAAAFNQNLDAWDISRVKTTRFMFMYARYFEKKPSWDMSNVEDVVGMYYGSPIVYVDPDLACGIDPALEAKAAAESLNEQIDSVMAQDSIARFAKNLSGKSTNLAERLEAKFSEKNEDEPVDIKQDSYHDRDSTSHTIIQRKNHAGSSFGNGSNESNGSSIIDDLERLQKLRDSGLLTEDELNILKQNLFASFEKK